MVVIKDEGQSVSIFFPGITFFYFNFLITEFSNQLRLRNTEWFEREKRLTQQRQMKQKKTSRVWNSVKSLWAGGHIIESENNNLKYEGIQSLSVLQSELASSPLNDLSLKSNGGELSKEREMSQHC